MHFHFWNPVVGLAIISHLDRVTVDPFGDFIVLEELSHDVVFEEVGNIALIVTATLPTFKVLHVVTTQEWIVGCPTITWIVPYPGIFLVVADETSNIRVNPLVSVATIG